MRLKPRQLFVNNISSACSSSSASTSIAFQLYIALAHVSYSELHSTRLGYSSSGGSYVLHCLLIYRQLILPLIASSHSLQLHHPPLPTTTEIKIIAMDQGKNVRARTAEASTLLTLPFDILLDIVGRLAIDSIEDVFRLRLSCKTFDLVGKHKYVLAKMAIEYQDDWGISVVVASRNDRHARSFLNQCVNAGNPEAIFQQGMVKFFTYCDHEAGIQDLLKASELGHDVASYVCGIAMYCCGSEDLKPKGFALLNSVKRKLGYKIISCRRRVADLFYDILVIARRPSFKWKRNTCKNITNGTAIRSCRRSNPWKNFQLLAEDKDDALSCEECTCTIECGLVEGMLQWITRNMVE